MKALIKGGIFLAFGWLATWVDAEEVQWKSAAAKLGGSSAITAPPGNGALPTRASIDSGVRPVSLNASVPLEGSRDSGAAPPAFRPVPRQPVSIIRAQAPEEKPIAPLPSLSVKEPPKIEAQPLPKGTGGTSTFPPPPTPTPMPFSVAPLPTPSPVWGNVGMMPEETGLGCGSGCGLDCFGASSNCCPDRGRFWASAAYLMWWQRSQNVPPLVTSATGGSGVLGDPRTSVLYDEIPNHTRSGGRFALGMWLPHFGNNLGFETNFFFLGRLEDQARFTSANGNIIARPFFNTTTGKQAAEGVVDAGVGGSVTVNRYSQVWGIEANLRQKWLCGPNYWVDFLAGYRHLNISEGISIQENLLTTGSLQSFLVRDSFATRNQFNGGQVGLDGECRFWNRMFVGGTAKVAFGNVYQMVEIDGSTTFNNGKTYPGGLLALPTNIGRYTQNRFAVLPEVGIKVGVDVTQNLRLFVGYDFIYLSSVVRPGEQIDVNVNPTFIPTSAGPGTGTGPRQPTVLFRTNDYWVQGLTFGLQYRW